VHVSVEKRLHIITFGPKPHSTNFVTVFFITASLLMFCNLTIVISDVTEMKADNYSPIL
jgi:hypothetical protein